MNRRSMLTPITMAVAWLWIALPQSNAATQPAADMEGVKAASKTFYAALSLNDNGEAISKVWAHTTYVTCVSPSSNSIMVGWDALGKHWVETKGQFSQMDVTLSEQDIHVNGNLAWEMGQESGTLKLKDGRDGKVDGLVTNVYEKVDGRWLIVSHHVQPKPQ